MPKHKESWLCIICGAEHLDEASAKKCEETHLGISEIVPNYDPTESQVYPDSVTVFFEDGRKQSYYRE